MDHRVLIVADEPETCELLHRVVNSAGMEALTTTDSSHAAGILRGGKFDLVVMDFRMPSPDGAELARQMRLSRPNRTTPVILISDDQRPSALSIGFAAGANFFLYKPIDKDRFLKLIRSTQGTIEQERRRTRRIPLRNRVTVKFGKEDLEGETVNISLSGLLIAAPRTVPVGSAVQFSLHLSKGAKPVAGMGSIARIAPGNQMGIHMDHLSSAESERLQEFLLPLISGTR